MRNHLLLPVLLCVLQTNTVAAYDAEKAPEDFNKLVNKCYQHKDKDSCEGCLADVHDEFNSEASRRGGAINWDHVLKLKEKHCPKK